MAQARPKALHRRNAQAPCGLIDAGKTGKKRERKVKDDNEKPCYQRRARHGLLLSLLSFASQPRSASLPMQTAARK